MAAMEVKNGAKDSSAYSSSVERVFERLKSSPSGLDREEARKRLEKYGPNVLPTQDAPRLAKVFVRQFRNPLIYVLLIAAVVSLALGSYNDALFIAIVLLVNAIIGTFQEYGAEKSALALKQMASAKCMVARSGEVFEIDGEFLVPGDVVLLESGRKVPADLRLFESRSLSVNESLLTGESEAVTKNSDEVFETQTSLGDRKNMAYTGTFVIKGRGKGIVVSTGNNTELGSIASSVAPSSETKPPLVVRMERFTKKIAVFLLFITLGIGGFLLWQGQPWSEVLLFSVAIAVSAIPEGLPVALTVALSIASRRMAKRNVIVRKLPAVEALGSTSAICADKTGTLTVNQLTIAKVEIPSNASLEVSGVGLDPAGTIDGANAESERPLEELVTAGVLCNESQLARKDGEWIGYGDAVDLAFLVLAYKAKLNPNEVRNDAKLVKEFPFESENQYAAVVHRRSGENLLSVKGALEKVLPMCSLGSSTKEREAVMEQGDLLAERGYRVLALAKKDNVESTLALEKDLKGLKFLGLVGMIDPLREEAEGAIHACGRAGIEVSMLTGDHPKTAFAIASKLGLAKDLNQVVTGARLKETKSPEEKDALVQGTRVFARVEPRQKLEIVKAFLAQGRFVAVTGDGANDVPALKAASVGVAMGKSGTDVAKESSDLIISDDRFASIVAGVEEGRIAYNNVRKVVYLLISTGAAEIILFCLSLLFNTPLPLTAVQVLWLNLVTNGIQDVGLAFEPGEGDELRKKPRPFKEPVFDRYMLERVVLSALVMGGVTFSFFYYSLAGGESEFAARNSTLLLMVLFQNIMVGNCRSETKSAFSLAPMRNRVLLFGTLGAQLVHIAALYTPGISSVLDASPVGLGEWTQLLFIALSVLAAVELYKFLRFRK